MPAEEEQARAYHATKKAFESRTRHIFPYVVEVSIDGGCCWSSASEQAPKARVLFANFPQRVTHVTPNNIAVEGGDSFGAVHEMMAARLTACANLDEGSEEFNVYVPDALEREHGFSYSVFVPAKIVTVERGNAERGRGGDGLANSGEGHTLAVQCVSPALDPTVLENFDTFVDVGLNGVHFTDRPQSLRVLDVQVLGISPDVGSGDRQTKVHIQANECFESENTAVLLRFPDGTEEILPAHVDLESQRISFWMPPKKSPQHPRPDKELADVADEVSNDSSEKAVSEETNKRSSASFNERTRCGAPDSPSASQVEDGLAPSNQSDHEDQIFVFLSFNGQVFSRQPAVFTHYCRDLCAQYVFAYTISENGDFFEADLDNVLSPHTHIVVSVQSAIASNSAQVRLTLLRSGNPAARDFLSCLHDEMPPLSAAASPTDADNDMPSHTSSAQEVPSPAEEAVYRVIYLDAQIDLEPQPLTLMPDPNRSKRKPGGARVMDNQRGKSGPGAAGSAGRAKAKTASGGGTATPGAANVAGGGQEGKSPPPGLGGPREQTGSSGGRNAAFVGGAAARGRRREKTENAGPDGADEKSRDPTLAFITPELTLPALTVEEQQAEAPEEFVFAVCDISLDGQRFIPVKEARVLRLQCSVDTNRQSAHVQVI
ncbi:conserved hypothetical protein [Neospora caninum Liverpool]|uniref:Uncharacterized protein n=1 Tax=Neospora caninum (strain Liverpool) TaxID=572307 RepID=F0V7D4_NEOCL|nr:conserved hypothetical protein [Neospora caninum Liverpool]CBZ49625.1 conserved hypothetical protein [Neospora caninum Liverpool]CEL64207.1 TPA: hypothetical protein BN1204_001160 [Neospora caninum Liverpool]|eukprot:XP_003879660.1 conserved hypothetical protein [Neospora caninum Liverpool]